MTVLQRRLISLLGAIGSSVPVGLMLASALSGGTDVQIRLAQGSAVVWFAALGQAWYLRRSSDRETVYLSLAGFSACFSGAAMIAPMLLDPAWTSLLSRVEWFGLVLTCSLLVAAAFASATPRGTRPAWGLTLAAGSSLTVALAAPLASASGTSARMLLPLLFHREVLIALGVAVAAASMLHLADQARRRRGGSAVTMALGTLLLAGSRIPLTVDLWSAEAYLLVSLLGPVGMLLHSLRAGRVDLPA